ncbi:serine/threonine-protein kinase [Microcoleus sp. FACHB-672]|uniref:serine/threonine-protein kinase n=1 Tax=Microcoleus sp. FACHB-672 TaxID=2692825 RepID=UPI001682FD74|nr:serine/threonine-protein kinase [Microcoleus sp. FACHB-672]MBD2042199.1 serine/threonine protein kinase [Microcoleus sp. FACHB-672]
MSYCLNPDCQNPQNLEGMMFCKNCGTKLLLKDRYSAIEVLGEGGFGRTFIAEDSDRLNARCVIKQFLPLSQVQQNSGLLQKATEMFTQEARQLLQLGDHPQIPALFADFEQEGRLYLIQEFIDGQNLLQELERKGAFSGEEIEELLLDLLPVLQYIHDRQVIHRDIKPENILRRKSDGKLVLIDFGVAKQLSASVLVKTGTKIGTEGYAPIEQLRGGKAYPASDIYSLGVTCIHLLTGTAPDELYDPMKGNWLWRSHLMEEGLAVRDRLGKVIDKLLQDWVSDRYQSAGEAIADLYWSLTSSSNSNSPTKIQHPNTGIPQSWRCVHTLAGHTNYVIGVAISPDGRTLASCSYDKTIKVWHLGNGQLLGTLNAHAAWVSSLAISPDGKTLVSGSLDNTIKLWELGSGNLRTTLTGHSGYIISLAISPDGKTLASGCFDNTIRLWHLETGNLMGTLTGHTGYVESLAISPDGKRLASGGGFDDNTINLWDLSSGNLIDTLKGHGASVRSVAFTPDGQRLASGSEDKTIKLWDLTTKTVDYTIANKSGWVQVVAVRPDGKLLATGSRDSTIHLWHLDSGQLQYTLKWHSGPVTSLAFSPDGTRLASGSWDNMIKIWQAE